MHEHLSLRLGGWILCVGVSICVWGDFGRAFAPQFGGVDSLCRRICSGGETLGAAVRGCSGGRGNALSANLFRGRGGKICGAAVPRVREVGFALLAEVYSEGNCFDM